MSFSDITIHRQIPIINNFMQLPDNLEKDKTAVTMAAYLAAHPTATLERLSGTGGARTAGGKFGVQEFVSLAAVAVG